jgi:hypothetical protein
MSILKVNTIQDRGGNAIISSDGSGNLTQTFASNTPAFEAYLSADQSISHATITKVQFNTERFDTNTNYDNSTNYRFTPTVAGKYFVYSNVNLGTGDYNLYSVRLYIYKNGSAYMFTGSVFNTSTALERATSISNTIDMNGTSDYLEIFGYVEAHGGSGEKFECNDKGTYFGAYRVIGA